MMMDPSAMMTLVVMNTIEIVMVGNVSSVFFCVHEGLAVQC